MAASTSQTGLSGASPDPVRTVLAANKPLFVSAFGFSAAMSILALTTSFYMLQVYDRVLTSRSEDTLLLLTIIAVVAIAVFSALDSLRLRLLQRIGMRVAEQLSPRVLRAMVATTSQNGGNAARTGVRDVETLRNFIGSAGFAAMLDAPFIFFYMLVLWLIDPVFLIFVIIGGAILLTIAVFNQRATNPMLARSLGESSRAYQFAEDGLRNADVLEGMGMSNAFTARWRKQWIESLAHATTASDRDSGLSSLSLP